MPGADADHAIMQEFLAECGELLESLEGDLIDLESGRADAGLINKIFRALHTIKGSASFLALAETVEITHAAESALNAVRSGITRIDRSFMDMLLRAVDAVRHQMNDIRHGATRPTRADPALVASLCEIGGVPPPPTRPGDGTKPVELDTGRAELLTPFIADLEAQMNRLGELIKALFDEQNRDSTAAEIQRLGDDLETTIDFFGFDSMNTLARSFVESAACAARAESVEFDQLLPRMRAVLALLSRQKEGLIRGTLYEPDSGRLIERLRKLAETGRADDEWRLPSDADELTVLRFDGVLDLNPAEAPDTAHPLPEPADSTATDHGVTPATAPRALHAEQTLRVEVKRLESLMNLAAELTAHTSHVRGLTRRASSGVSPHLAEALEHATSGLERLSGEVRSAIMQTRMQPLDTLFVRATRLIRDLASKTGKRLRLDIVGGRTEADKQVLEELADPLIHILRNSADHGIETPSERAAAGKPETGTITISATNPGSHVEIVITDDGRGLNRQRIAAKAAERGLATTEALGAMTDAEVFAFIFTPGFSTAESVSDLSGRGVGMDVVRTNIERLNGSIGVVSTPGEGTSFRITIPTTLTLMPALIVRVAGEPYAFPLAEVHEIIRPEPDELSAIRADRALDFGGENIPLLDAAECFDTPPEADDPALALVLDSGGRRTALLISGVIGREEVIVRPLESLGLAGPFIGATIRTEGEICLILDAAELTRSATHRNACRRSETWTRD